MMFISMKFFFSKVIFLMQTLKQQSIWNGLCYAKIIFERKTIVFYFTQ